MKRFLVVLALVGCSTSPVEPYYTPMVTQTALAPTTLHIDAGQFVSADGNAPISQSSGFFYPSNTSWGQGSGSFVVNLPVGSSISAIRADIQVTGGLVDVYLERLGMAYCPVLLTTRYNCPVVWTISNNTPGHYVAPLTGDNATNGAGSIESGFTYMLYVDLRGTGGINGNRLYSVELDYDPTGAAPMLSGTIPYSGNASSSPIGRMYSRRDSQPGSFESQ